MSGSDHGDHHGSPFIQHHFDDAEHQFQAGKLGIWLFLVQEVLFFSGLFVAYIVFRAHHSEVYLYANAYLDTAMGATNTAILILSSLTAAWSVRCAQLNQRKGLIICLVITLACACGFLGIKYVEYSHKIHIGTLFGPKFAPTEDPQGRWYTGNQLEAAKAGAGTKEREAAANALGEVGFRVTTPAPPAEGETPPVKVSAVRSGGPAAEAGLSAGDEIVQVNGKAVSSTDLAGFWALVEVREGTTLTLTLKSGKAVTLTTGPPAELPPPNTSMFFSIYFAMTGLHGIHVLAGVFVYIWLLLRAIRRDFGPEYYGPIDFAALYWHLVDLIWIFLFPLFYLIH